MARERADVLVIGSGAAGGAVSKRLADYGAKVVCLEQGDWVEPSRYPSTRPDWEVQLQRGPWNFNPNVRRRPEDYPVVSRGSHPPSVLMFNAVGGSTIHWTGHFPRFHPSDFRVRTLDGVADDWPISYQELEPYYDANDREMGISGIAGDPCNPPRKGRPTPPLPLGVLGETIARGFDKLGWYWWVSDNAIISQEYDGRPGCTLHGKCMLGCPIAAKASTDVTYWPKALQKGTVLRTRARVREITLDSSGRARGAIYYDRAGKLHEELARVIVVCCNGVGTPRLLLNSKSKLFPNGLANSSGLVGKNFMLHPFRMIEGVFEQPMYGWLGPFGIPAFSQHFYETDLSRGFVRGYTFLLERSFGPLHEAWGGFTSRPVPWGKDHHRIMRQRFGHVIRVTLLGEDLPEEHNRVELDPSVTDGNGIPAPRVIYSYSENSLRMQEHSARTAKQVLEAAGAYQVFDSGIIQPAFHLMGTARMGNDPKKSVINRWHQAHDVKNLFIVDGSSFVTGAAVNPTSTIGALALRAGDAIWSQRREWQ
ncbi:MAG TPA: GMC family oxidoreductase [Acidobacteriota bacterium]|jgi:choline dehydrogenase-like flavoprotein|nr:GMC family oxidoreductase [Acidobacteriota bacterium]